MIAKGSSVKMEPDGQAYVLFSSDYLSCSTLNHCKDNDRESGCVEEPNSFTRYARVKGIKDFCTFKLFKEF